VKKAAKAALITGQESVEGTVEQIVFYNPDNGYTVCRFLPDGGQAMTVVGAFPPLSPGEVLRIKGQWELSPRFGQQFRVEHFALTLPSSARGVEKFLASGLVHGIGPVLATRIVKVFGAGTVDILTSEPERLLEVEGVGRVKLAEIRKSWAEHQDIRDLIMFLQEHDVSTNLATKIYRQYGDRSFTVLKTSPYQLSLDIWGVGFKTADQLALKLGMDPGSIERVKAYILYLLEKDNEQGHVFSLAADVRAKCVLDLGVEGDKADRALDILLQGKNVVAEEFEGGRALYLPFYFQAQEEVVRSIHALAGFPCGPPDIDLGQAMAETEKDLGLAFSALQRQAIRESSSARSWSSPAGPGPGRRPSSGPSSTSSSGGARRPSSPRPRDGPPSASRKRRGATRGPSTGSSNSIPSRIPSRGTSGTPCAGRPSSSTNSRWSICR